MLILWCGSVDLAVGAGIVGGRLPAYVGGALSWVAVGLMAGTYVVTVRAICYVGLVLLSAMTIPTIWLASWWTKCHVGDFDKCSFVGALFQGAAGSENYVAILASFTAVAAQVSFRGRTRSGVMAFCVLIIACTGSRTGLLAIAMMWAYCLIAQRWDRRRPQQRMSVSAAVDDQFNGRALRDFPDIHRRSGHAQPAWLDLDRGTRDARRLALHRHRPVEVGSPTGRRRVPAAFLPLTYALFLFAGGSHRNRAVLAVELFDASRRGPRRSPRGAVPRSWSWSWCTRRPR